MRDFPCLVVVPTPNPGGEAVRMPVFLKSRSTVSKGEFVVTSPELKEIVEKNKPVMPQRLGMITLNVYSELHLLEVNFYPFKEVHKNKIRYFDNIGLSWLVESIVSKYIIKNYPKFKIRHNVRDLEGARAKHLRERGLNPRGLYGLAEDYAALKKQLKSNRLKHHAKKEYTAGNIKTKRIKIKRKK